ncbi:MAG: glycosyltransferase [Phycisphaerales bacterium]|nr:glycosyltransferase [Phycisphaerales bacterium]
MTPDPPTLRVAVIADEPIALRERELIQRLQIGLADEGVRVASAVPRSALTRPGATLLASSDLFAHAIVYDPAGVRWGRSRRMTALVGALGILEGATDHPVDVVHALGPGSWDTAMELAHRTGAGLAVSIWNPPMARAIGRARPPSGQRGEPATAAVMLVPDPALERILRQELEDAPLHPSGVRVISWGVHSHAAPRDLLRPGRLVSMVLGGGGSDASAYEAALEGVSRLRGRSEDFMVLADAEMAERAGLARIARRLSLTDRFTLVPEVEARRELILAADMLLLPEAAGDHRSLTLDAMASGALVVAMEDPLVSYLIDGRTARLVAKPDPDLWAAALASLLDRRDRAAALADSARDYVRQHHRASTHIAGVLDAYEWLAGREPIPFGARGAG